MKNGDNARVSFLYHPPTLRSLASWLGVWLVCWGAMGCGAIHSFVDSPSETSRLSSYPRLFQQPTSKDQGIGFAPLYPRSMDASYQRAHATARTMLAWSEHVRVAGSRQFEYTPAGHLEFRGEHIDLLEIAPIDSQDCRYDTARVGSFVWIQAYKDDPSRSIDEAVELSETTPPWIAHPPPDGPMLYALGTARVARSDEPGSWEVATYNALVETAFKNRALLQSLERSEDHRYSGVSVFKVDTVLRGWRIVYRWRDAHHAYVLAGIPRRGITSNLD